MGINTALEGNMKKLYVIILSAVVLLVSFSTVISGEKDLDELKITYTFKYPTITDNTKITISGIENTANLGEPSLPSVAATILIPYKEKPDKILITPGKRIKLGNDFDIPPTSRAIPLSKPHSSENVKIIKDEAIYSSDKEFPGTLFEKVGTYSFRGYSILILNLFPVQYNPVTGDAFFYERIDVTVETVDTDDENSLYRGGIDEKEVMGKVDNPVAAPSYPKTHVAPLEDYDLLILTTDGLKDSFIPLKEAHDLTGVNTAIRTLSDVGGSTQEDIRNYIRNVYNDSGIEYVLLGGDSDIIPTRKLYAEVNGGDTTDHIPSDVYYACLDGTYNYDGDNKWGESTDGEDGGDVDLLAEVYIGRTCVGNTGEVDNFVEKTLAYLNTDENDSYIRKILMVGEKLDASTWGGDSMDALINYGISEDIYNIDKLYDKDGTWSASQLINKIEADVHMINHLGHSSNNYVMKLYNSQVDGLENDKLFFVYTQGCYPGAFDQGDCIGEHFTVKTQHAAFAGVFNARYGWYSPGSANGLSQKFHRSFVKGLFEEELGTIGRTNHYSKEYYISSINQNGMRWCFYQTNLFGDPSLVMYTKDEAEPAPKIEVGDITGGLFLSFIIKNNGTDRAENVSWDVKVDGGLFGFIHVDENGDCEPIATGSQETIKLNRLIFGFGVVEITVSAECSTGSSDARMVNGSVIFIPIKIFD